MSIWPWQEATARFHERLHRAEAEGPQEITVQGKPTAVLVSRAEFDRMSGPTCSFVAFMRASPLAGLELERERDRSSDRKVTL